ncbi:MAG: HlyD family secretion protein [Imperialibacter sp.]|uniref:HlyD family secretion protein n=1 Tax=Imperialibacter sp. TaxID=2038411 RepID=UPI003A8AB1BC
MSIPKQNYYAFYITIVLLAGALLYFSLDYPVRKANLYGVVESPKVRLNHPRKAVILEVNVTPGQKVEKGAVLMRLESQAILDDLQDLAYKEGKLEATSEKELFEFEIEKNELALELQQEHTKRDQAIAEIRMEENRDASWLKNFTTAEAKDTTSAAAWKLEIIEQNFEASLSENKLKQSLLLKKRQLQVKAVEASREELLHEKQRLEAENASLVLLAPASGIVDNVYFMEGQTADGFSDLLSLLPDENKFVRAYITDQTNIVGDLSRVVVQSALETDKKTTATYIGSGGVEVLPAMMQQLPVQQSGKEIFFKLDNTKGWLQGEKVMILVP